MTFRYRLAIGDWSDDGHGKCDHFRYETSHDREQIIAAYKETANAAGVSVCDFRGFRGIVVCADYEDDLIPEDALAGLAEIGITRDDLLDTDAIVGDDEEGDLSACPEGLAELFMMMVTKSLPDFTYSECKKDDCINGYWQDDFNCSIGYGAYH
jgi:hypothetical protein